MTNGQYFNQLALMGLEVRNIVGNIRDNLENTSGDTSGGIRN